jgi:hypothetical protein
MLAYLSAFLTYEILRDYALLTSLLLGQHLGAGTDKVTCTVTLLADVPFPWYFSSFPFLQEYWTQTNVMPWLIALLTNIPFRRHIRGSVLDALIGASSDEVACYVAASAYVPWRRFSIPSTYAALIHKARLFDVLKLGSPLHISCAGDLQWLLVLLLRGTCHIPFYKPLCHI